MSKNLYFFIPCVIELCICAWRLLMVRMTVFVHMCTLTTVSDILEL